MAVVKGVQALKQELEKAKDNLKDVDQNIAKLTGRDPTEGRGMTGARRGRGRGSDDFRGRGGRLFNLARRGLMDDGVDASPGPKRVIGTAFSRLGPRVIASRLGPRQHQDSGDEEETSKHTVQSSVVATPKETRSRADVAEQQNTGRESRGRNRRMFGALIGTLQRFQSEEKEKGEQEKKRKEVEVKLEQKARDEQDELRRERQQMLQERKAKEAKVKQLEMKMELVKIHEEWESQTSGLGHFIRTKTKPHLYYLPKSHISTTEKRLKDTEKILEDIIKERRKVLEEEIEELTHHDSVGVDDHEKMETGAEQEPSKAHHDRHHREPRQRRHTNHDHENKEREGKRDRDRDREGEKGVKEGHDVEMTDESSVRKGGEGDEGKELLGDKENLVGGGSPDLAGKGQSNSSSSRRRSGSAKAEAGDSVPSSEHKRETDTDSKGEKDADGCDSAVAVPRKRGHSNVGEDELSPKRVAKQPAEDTEEGEALKQEADLDAETILHNITDSSVHQIVEAAGQDSRKVESASVDDQDEGGDENDDDDDDSDDNKTEGKRTVILAQQPDTQDD